MDKATPESVGISSVSLSNLINRLDSFHIPMHSLLIARHGKLILEAYYEPYTKDTLHRMFSVTKSFTSIGIGLLEAEGLLSLKDNIVDYFEDLLPEEVHPYLNTLTIKDMLSMQACHESTTYKKVSNMPWVESFFKVMPTHRPGTVFTYDTSATHVLGALIEKLTGMSLLDYLKSSPLKALSLSDASYIIKDPYGVSMGGTGLMALPEDMLAFATFIINAGKYNNQPLLSSTYIKDAVALHAHTCINGPIPEERHGYGYQFWRIRNNGYMAYGMGGQLAICLPDEDLIVVTTADTQGMAGGNQLIYNSLFETVVKDLESGPIPVSTTASETLASQVAALTIKAESGVYTSKVMKAIQNCSYTFLENAAGFESITLTFGAINTIHFRLNGQDHQLAFGFGETVKGSFPVYNQTCVSSGVWLDAHTLYIKSHIIDECIGSVQFHLTFTDNKLTIYMKKIEETYFNEFSGYFECVSP